MAECYYEPTPATDGATMNPVPGAVFQVFELSDTGFTSPLSLRVGAGNPATTVAASESLATLPGVWVTSPNFEHIWKSGTFEWRRDSIDGAKAAIQDAKVAAVDAAASSGSSAQSSADSAQAAQAAAALVDAPADTVLADLAGNPDSQFATQLNATTAENISTEGTVVRQAVDTVVAGAIPARPLVSQETPCEVLARAVDFGHGFLRVAVAGDSTWNDANDAVMKFGIRVGQVSAPDFGVKMRFFDAAAQAYKAWTNIKAGAETPATGGVVLTDNFNRTSADLVGGATSGGQVWGGVAGAWTSDGSLAHSASASSVPLSFDTGTPDGTITAVLDLTTATNGTGPQARIYAASDVDNLAGDAVFAQFSISTTGIPNLRVYKRIGGTSTEITTADFSMGLTNNTAAVQKVTITVQVQIQNVIVTLTPEGGATETYSGTITESDYAALGGYVGTTIAINTGDYIRLDSFQAETPYTPVSFNGLEIWNGAVAGSNLPYQQARLGLLYPAATHFDILAVSGGHNKGTTTPEDFIAEVDAFIAAYKAVHPESLILISSQNPQFAPAPYVATHAARQAALRAYAMENGYEYLPVFEAFTAQDDGGAALVQSDGVHPTYPDMPNASTGIYKLTWSGSVLWASMWLQAINSRRVANLAPLTAIP